MTDMHVGTARVDHPEVIEIAPSAHCVMRFRQRMPIRAPGIEEVAIALLSALEEADVSAWPPAWAAGGDRARLWAATPDLAFPLEPTPTPGRWVAVTCLRRESGSPAGPKKLARKRSSPRSTDPR